jgi:hypothetical protein
MVMKSKAHGMIPLFTNTVHVKKNINVAHNIHRIDCFLTLSKKSSKKWLKLTSGCYCRRPFPPREKKRTLPPFIKWGKKYGRCFRCEFSYSQPPRFESDKLQKFTVGRGDRQHVEICPLKKSL